MSAENAVVGATARTLRRRALSLGAARGFDYALQLLLPIVLVRALDGSAFGQYRLLWLLVGTVMAIATLAMPASLFYFLPRSDEATQRLYVNQTLIFLIFAGAVAACAVAGWNPWLPASMHGLAHHGALVPAFVLLWVVASLLDLLPSVDERIGWQANATIGLAVLRAAALAAVGLSTHRFEPVLAALLGFAAAKTAVLAVYVGRCRGFGGPLLRWPLFKDQIRYAAPFGTGGALYVLRVQADQWIAATLFSVSAFAAFSLAAVLDPLLNVFRHAVSTAFLPSISRSQAGGDIRHALALNSRANVFVAALVYPLLAFAFVFANDLVTLVYTPAYIAAAAVMRVYVFGASALVIELATLTLVLRQGPFVMGLNLLTLIFSALLSWSAARHFGLAGAAVGSVTAAYTDRVLTLWRIGKLTEIPFRRLQDWRSLGLLASFAAFAAAVAGLAVALCAHRMGCLPRVLVGAGVLAAAYGGLCWPLARASGVFRLGSRDDS